MKEIKNFATNKDKELKPAKWQRQVLAHLVPFGNSV